MVTSRRGQRGVERGPGECYQWTAKGQCSRGDRCSFRHDGDERAKSTPKTAPFYEPLTQRGRSASRTRNLSGWSPSGKFNRQPFKYFLKDMCTKLPCEYWHPPECPFYKSESGCKFFNNCSFPHRKVKEQPNDKPNKGGDKSAVAVVEDVRQFGLRFHRFYGRAQKSWDQFDEYDSRKHCSVMLTSEKVKVHRLVKYKSNFLISAVPAP